MKQANSDRKTLRFLFLGYVVLALIGTITLKFQACTTNGISFIDALFTSASAISMTGLIVKNTASDFTLYGQIAILILIQVGGLGYMGFGAFLYVLVRKKIGFTEKNLLKQSLIYPSMEGIIKFLKKVLIFVFLAEFVGAVFLSLRFMLDMDIVTAIWYGVFHSVASFNNAGFSLFENGLTDFAEDTWINMVVSTLILTGGIGYFALLEVYFFHQKRLANLSLHTKIVLISTLFFTLFATIIIFLFEYTNKNTLGELNLFNKILSSYFAAVNYRSGGYATLDFSEFKDASLFFGSLFMVIGGAPGGTSGGIKVTTVVVLLVYAYWTIRGGRIRIFNYEIPQDVISKAFVIGVSSATCIIFYVIILSLLESEHRFLPLLFETVSAFATVGVSVGNGDNLSLSALFSDESKMIIIIMMITGRIGVYAFLLSVFMQDKEKFIRYPQGKVYL